MIGSLKHAAQVLSSEKPYTAISQWIETLCLPSYEEDSYDGIPELIESIRIQGGGPVEASRAIRKKLKYSNVPGQLRVLTILNALVENCGPRFQETFANERLVDRIKLMAGDPLCDPAVKRKLMRLLQSWHSLFREDTRMQIVAGLWSSCGGGKKAAKSAAVDAYNQQQQRYDRESAERNERKARERNAKEEAKEEAKQKLAKEKDARKRKEGASKIKRVAFDFEKEKPLIMRTVAESTQASNALVNALLHVDRTKEDVTVNPRVVSSLTVAKNLRKICVRYIQLLENDDSGDFIGTLLSTNESILAAIALYDRMSKPTDLDSDDEPADESRYAGGLKPQDDDVASIRSRLSAFDVRESEVDKLQERQRLRVAQSNRDRAIRETTVHPDLLDLNFTASSSASSSAPVSSGTFTRTLSEYSYSSSSSSSSINEVSHHRDRGAATSAGQGDKPYAQYLDDGDSIYGNRAGLLEEGGDEDPFGDNAREESLYEVGTPGIVEKRMEWKEV